MKFSVLLLFVIPVVLSAQEFPLKTSTWYYTNNGGGAAPNTYLWKVRYEKDSIVKGKIARVLKTADSVGYGLRKEYIFHYSNDTVYSLTRSGNWGVLYVFSAKAGDTIHIPDFDNDTDLTFPFIIDSVVNIQYGSTIVKRFYAPGSQGLPGSGFFEGYYQERIGSTFFYPTILGGLILEHAVIRCYEDSTINELFNYTGPCDKGNPYSIEELSDESIVSIYPSYSSGKINIESKNEKDFVVKVYDHHGRIVQQKEMKDHGNASLFFDNSIPDGLYFVNVKTSKGNFTQKVFLER